MAISEFKHHKVKITGCNGNLSVLVFSKREINEMPLQNIANRIYNGEKIRLYTNPLISNSYLRYTDIIKISDGNYNIIYCYENYPKCGVVKCMTYNTLVKFLMNL